MSKFQMFLFTALLSLSSQQVFGGCSFFASIAPNILNGAYVAQIIDQSSQQVLAQVGPIAHGQSSQKNFACSNNPVYAKFIYTQNSNYNYSSGPFILTSGNEAACALYADYTVRCSIRPCYQCEEAKGSKR